MKNREKGKKLNSKKIFLVLASHCNYIFHLNRIFPKRIFIKHKTIKENRDRNETRTHQHQNSLALHSVEQNFSFSFEFVPFQISLYSNITGERRFSPDSQKPIILYTVTSSENLLLSSRLMTIACVLAWPDLLLLLSRSLTSLFLSSCFVSVPMSSVAGLPEVETATSLVLIGFFISTETSASPPSFDEPWSTPLIPFFSTHASHFFPPFTSPPRHTFVHPCVMCRDSSEDFFSLIRARNIEWRDYFFREWKICENLIGA